MQKIFDVRGIFLSLSPRCKWNFPSLTFLYRILDYNKTGINVKVAEF